MYIMASCENVDPCQVPDSYRSNLHQFFPELFLREILVQCFCNFSYFLHEHG